MSCKICAAAPLEEVREYAALPRVTSDCKPWPAGGRMAICMSCGAVQKFADERWLAEAAAIYRDYEMYYQSDGVEQGVFDAVTGQPSPRSRRLAEFLDATFALPEEGSILDVGCGSGVTLAAFAGVKQRWSLFGYDLDERRLDRMRKLANFRALYTGDAAGIPGEYSIVSLVHAAEHLPDPLLALRGLMPRLGGRGRLFIQVPDCRVNPLDLVVADHLLHFSLGTLVRLVEAAGYQVETATDSLIIKELTVVATPRHAGSTQRYPVAEMPPARKQLLVSQLGWLNGVIAGAERVAALGPLGIFGTSVAATWIAGVCKERIEFFVDEDPSRIGRSFMNRPVYPLGGIPRGGQVYIPLAPVVAHNIKQRYSHLPVAFHLPPAASF